MFYIVTRLGIDGRIDKFLPFDDAASAQRALNGYFTDAPTPAPIFDKEGVEIEQPQSDPIWVAGLIEAWPLAFVAEIDGALHDLVINAGVLEFSPIAPPPITVTPWQAREALRLSGLLDDVENYINGLGASSAAYNAWHYAPFFRRDHALIATLAVGMGLTSEQLDGLFAVADGLSL